MVEPSQVVGSLFAPIQILVGRERISIPNCVYHLLWGHSETTTSWPTSFYYFKNLNSWSKSMCKEVEPNLLFELEYAYEVLKNTYICGLNAWTSIFLLHLLFHTRRLKSIFAQALDITREAFVLII